MTAGCPEGARHARGHLAEPVRPACEISTAQGAGPGSRAGTPTLLNRAKASGCPSALRQLPEHEGENASVPVVIDLVRRIDPAGDGELLRPLVAHGLHH